MLNSVSGSFHPSFTKPAKMYKETKDMAGKVERQRNSEKKKSNMERNKSNLVANRIVRLKLDGEPEASEKMGTSDATCVRRNGESRVLAPSAFEFFMLQILDCH